MKAHLVRNLDKIVKQLELDGYEVRAYIKEVRNEYPLMIKLKEGDIEDIMSNNVRKVEGV